MRARRVLPGSLEMGLEALPSANFVLIWTPGEDAAAAARKALQLGLHAMRFSDNVRIEEEIPLTQCAPEQHLLVIGQDSGTAMIHGVPLGFANVVRRGDIGVVAACGTGLQQATGLIDRFGGSITQAIGTGGHDLKSEVGGMPLDAIACTGEMYHITIGTNGGFTLPLQRCASYEWRRLGAAAQTGCFCMSRCCLRSS